MLACCGSVTLPSGSRAGDDTGAEIVELVNYFFDEHLLAWLEVLSIWGHLRVAVYSLHNFRSWLTDVRILYGYNDSSLTFYLQCTSPSSSLLNFIDDCERFVLQFFDPIELSAMHIYHSALPWSPASSLIRQQYQRQMTTEVKLLNAIDRDWDPYIKAIPIDKTAIAMTFSHNDSALAFVSKEYIKIYEITTGVATFEVDQSAATSVDFSPDDDCVWVQGWDNQGLGCANRRSRPIVCRTRRQDLLGCVLTLRQHDRVWKW
jgi:hypothetical protein